MDRFEVAPKPFPADQVPFVADPIVASLPAAGVDAEVGASTPVSPMNCRPAANVADRRDASRRVVAIQNPDRANRPMHQRTTRWAAQWLASAWRMEVRPRAAPRVVASTGAASVPRLRRRDDRRGGGVPATFRA